MMLKQDMKVDVRPLDGNLEFVKRDLSQQTKNIDFSKGPVVDIKDVKIIPEYKVNINF